MAAAVEPRFQTYTGNDPVAFVVSLNLRRRHMDASERAMAGARIKCIFEEQARARQEASRAHQGEKVGAKVRAELPAPTEEPKHARAKGPPAIHSDASRYATALFPVSQDATGAEANPTFLHALCNNVVLR